MSSKATRRDVLKALGGMTLIFHDEDEEDEDEGGWIDKDGDGEYLDDILGLDDEEPAKIEGSGELHIGKKSKKDEVDVRPDRFFFAYDSEEWFKPGDTDWQHLSSTGKNPTFEENVTDSGVIEERFSLTQSEFNPHLVRSTPEITTPFYRSVGAVSNPVIQASDVSDFAADEIADPFPVYENGQYHLFAEAFNTSSRIIVHLTSPGGLSWTYDQDTGLSDKAYPLVRKIGGTWYMTPDNDNKDLEIWKADTFPTSWSKVETNLTGSEVTDPTPIFSNDRWFLIAADKPNGNIRLYQAEETGTSLTGQSWIEHSSSPILTQSGDGVEGPSGYPIETPHYIDVPYQTSPAEGVDIRRIDELTASNFSDAAFGHNPVIESFGSGWRTNQMHHLAENDGIVMVDGRGDLGGDAEWSIGVFRRAERRVGEQSIDFLTAERLEVRNESLVIAETDAEVTGISAGEQTSPSFGTVTKDERDDFSSDQFTPDETGFYLVMAFARTKNNAESGDILTSRLRDVDDGDTVQTFDRWYANGSPGAEQYPPCYGIFELEGGNAHEYQVANADSSFGIDDASGRFVARSVFR